MDPPWDPRIKFQVKALHTFLAEQINLYKKKVAEREKIASDAKRDKDAELEARCERERLKREIDELRKIQGNSPHC